MSDASPSILGADLQSARSFTITYTTAAMANGIAIAAGGYEIVAAADCDVKLATTNAAVSAVLTDGAQPASVNRTMRVLANQPRPFDVPASGTWYISAIGVTAGGKLAINGPLLVGANRG